MKMWRLEKIWVNRTLKGQWSARRFRSRLQTLDLTGVRDVLEIGCGRGHVAAELARTQDVSVLAVDVDPQQIELADRAELIVDADDLLTDPEWYLRAMCERLSVEFTPSMLTWPAGPRASDGCWAEYWYASVEASTGFHQTPPSPPPPIDSLPVGLRPLAIEALGLYRDLANQRVHR